MAQHEKETRINVQMVSLAALASAPQVRAPMRGKPRDNGQHDTPVTQREISLIQAWATLARIRGETVESVTDKAKTILGVPVAVSHGIVLQCMA